ncbi:hypothetical protein [Olivibacter domesticus]|uniref:Uncharacterized protein n=1 Tax=Olivibacter domesticus TaxID=407022 RepID=A0A1H7I9A7_OLID1|nr:hypothetical protein [Olivibacter domesticus]SEK58924.1 hypothetical protein SAMN05661044_00622 [Olivibacter domesticus]
MGLEKICRRWVMKVVVLMFFLLGALGGQTLQAQTFSEWFKQKKTQKKYLAQQIAALEVYKRYLRDGWDIAQTGLTAIRKFNGGEWGLHELFFTSLKKINPAIKSYPKIGEIILLQVRIIDVHNRNMRDLQSSGMLDSEELSFVDGAYDKLMMDCSALIDELTELTTAGHFELNDDERISRIDQLYEEAMGQYTFAHEFGKEALILAMHRTKERDDVRFLGTWQGIDP